MKRSDERSDCPVNYAVETFGDTWSLLIVRDIVTAGKSTFGDFLASDEAIGPSVLAQRLAFLERRGILTKSVDPADGRRSRYSLTEAGANLIPLVYELTTWGTLTNPATDTPDQWRAAMRLPRERVIAAWRTAVARGSSFYTGPHSVVAQLSL